MSETKDLKASLLKLKDTLTDGALELIKEPMRAMPLWVDAIGAGAVISAITEANPNFKERLGELEGKLFLFDATDINKRFYMLIENEEINVRAHVVREPDVIMRGEVRVLVEMLLGRVDPDTVFFSRRLEIEGDTAVAILFKNILADI